MINKDSYSVTGLYTYYRCRINNHFITHNQFDNSTSCHVSVLGKHATQPIFRKTTSSLPVFPANPPRPPTSQHTGLNTTPSVPQFATKTPSPPPRWPNSSLNKTNNNPTEMPKTFNSTPHNTRRRQYQDTQHRRRFMVAMEGMRTRGIHIPDQASVQDLGVRRA